MNELLALLLGSFPYGVAGVSFGAAGFVLGKVQRERRYRREARANLALANARAIDRANARANKSRSLAVSDVDNDGAAFALASVRGGTGRRAIPRPDNRARVGRYVAGRNSDFEYAPSLIGAGDERF